MFFILLGVALGIAAGFIPGFNSNNLSLVLIAYGFISSNYYLAVTVVSVEISSSFFEFMSPMIFGIGNEATSLAITSMPDELTEENFKRSIRTVISGGLVGILISLPLLFLADRIYPLVYSSLQPLVGWILLFLCVYMVWIEKSWRKKFFAAAIFCLSGVFGLLVKSGGLISSEYLLLPVFIGLYGFSSIISKRHEKTEIDYLQETAWGERARPAAIGFITSVFASLISGMKRGQTSALAMQIGGVSRREEVLFMLPMISLAFVTLSIFALGSAGKIRSYLAYDIQEVMGELYFSQTVLLTGTVVISACVSACLLIVLAKPIGKFFSKINKKWLEIFGFCIGSLLIMIFTGAAGAMLAFTATCIGVLSSRLGIRSTHLMGVLLLPSIVLMIS